MEERCELPQRGPWQSRGRQRILGIFESIETFLVTMVFDILSVQHAEFVLKIFKPPFRGFDPRKPLKYGPVSIPLSRPALFPFPSSLSLPPLFPVPLRLWLLASFIPAVVSGECCKLPQQGLGQSK